MKEEAPVLIVGGSLVGLTASVLLGGHGVRHILIERHRGTAIHPRAAAFHQRTLEIYRSVGLQEAVEQAAERAFSRMLELIEHGQAEGLLEPGDPERVGLVLFATIQGIATLVTAGIVGPDQVDALLADSITHFLRGSRAAV